MKSAILIAVLATLQAGPIAAQTYTSCNPLTSGNCPADTALGRSVDIDFTQGQSDSFTPQGNPTYDSSGAGFTVAKSGDSPQLTSKWYIMFGHVEFTLKPAPGVGIVSSAVMQSDDLDEIDWEWLGGDSQQVQSNYFGKGQTTTYNRGAFHANPNNQAAFHTYTIDWTADQIAWQIDGTTVRTLTPETAEAGQYPQTPMMIKVGSWSGGDPSNAPGTVQWAGGPTDYSAGPYTMYVKSIAVTDYSTGSQYTYSGTDGTWQSIKSNGGAINSNSKGATPVDSAAPAVTSTSNSAPMPFEGTHRDTSSTIVKSGYPWVATTLQTSATSTATTYPGLPAGWTVTSSGKVLPPSNAAPSPSRPTSTSQDSSPQASGAAGGYKVTTGWDQRGFKTTKTVADSAATQKPQYNEQGFLITPTPALQSRSSPTPAAKVADQASSGANVQVHKAAATNGAQAKSFGSLPFLGAACLGGALLL
ncbi:MAG: hypothetical protein Q9191_000818 [Dirinaria sp. TL-2023a]